MYTVDPNSPASEAKGIAITDAKVGEDLGLKTFRAK